MRLFIVVLLQASFCSLVWAEKASINLSIKQEIERSLDMGLKWLSQEQNGSSGNWGLDEYPALTGLAIRSFLGHPSTKTIKRYEKSLQKGIDFIRSKVQSDGGIYGKGLASYNTDMYDGTMQAKDSEDTATIQNARKFLVNQQSDFDRKGVSDNVFDGGVDTARRAHSDLSNTHLAMEAFLCKEDLQENGTRYYRIGLDAAISFVKCQNLPATNNEQWVSEHPEDRGGFVYFPGSSMAGKGNSNGSKALRSYGSMSYAGLSFIYAEMDSTTPRVVAVKDWLNKNYTIEENTGMRPRIILLLSYYG